MARSHAYGVDFYRAAYPNGLFDGVYTTRGMAQRQVNEYNRHAERNPNSAWHQGYANGKVQKLEPVYMECIGDPRCLKNGYGSLCIVTHGLELKWLDVEE